PGRHQTALAAAVAGEEGHGAAVHRDRGGMEGGEAAALEPVGHDGPEEAELGEVELGSLQADLDPLGLNEEVAGAEKAKRLPCAVAEESGPWMISLRVEERAGVER